MYKRKKISVTHGDTLCNDIEMVVAEQNEMIGFRGFILSQPN